MYFTVVSYESSWGSRSQSPGEIPCPCFLLTVLTAIHAHVHCTFTWPYSATGKTMNTWNISRMFIVLWPITAKIRTCELATKPQTNWRSCLWFSFLMTDWLFSCRTIVFHKNFWCSRFSRFDCNISFQDLVHTRLYGNERAKWTIKMRNSSPVSATGPETLWCLSFWELTSLPCNKQALPEELNKADCCQCLQHLSVLLKQCTGFYGKQRKIESQVRHDMMYLDFTESHTF